MMNTVIYRVPICLILAAHLTACVPMPNVAHLRPAVSGILVEDKKPIPDVELFLGKYPGNNHPCTEVGEVVPVAPDGSFSWASVQERKFTDSLVNPVAVRGAVTVLCIRHPRKGILIGAMLFMKQDKPSSLRLVCDVARPRGSVGAGPDTTSTMLGQAQYCEVSTAD